jgi:type 1 fimbria pilin
MADRPSLRSVKSKEMSMLFRNLAICAALVSATAASAAVYAPSFNGPVLDPSITVTEPAGFTHTVSLGTLVLSKFANAGQDTPYTYLYATYSPSFSPTGNYEAKLTVNASQMGGSGFIFGAFGANSATSIAISQFGIVSFISLDDPWSGPYVSDVRQGNIFTLDILQKNDVMTLSVNGETSLSAARQNGPVQIYFSFANRFNSEENYTTAFVTNFSITTPDACAGNGICGGGTSPVPEPASGMLLMAGLGLTGAVMRRRTYKAGCDRA